MSDIYRSYSELIQLKTFRERFNYLRIGSRVGEPTFGYDRYLNQKFYASSEWKRFRNEIIIRDNGCDLGIDDGDHYIHGRILIHHLNPITIQDFRDSNYRKLINPENAICVSHKTHEAIHYNSDDSFIFEYVERRPGDTDLW